MKKITIIGLLLSTALLLNARTYVPGENIFVNVQQTITEGEVIGDWSKDGAKIYLYLFQSTNGSVNKWLQMTPTHSGSKVYMGTMDANIWYDRLIVVRGTAPNWDSKWNQTDDIDIPDNGDCNCNYLNIFNPSVGDKWGIYSPAASAISAFADAETADVIHVCPSAANEPLTLRPKLNGDTTNYLYDNVIAHAWYKKNGASWEAVSTYAGAMRTDENFLGKDLYTTLPATLPATGIYYFLYSTRPEGRHLIYVLPDATDCDLNCTITSFETAISAVNADDNTYTLDGMVAFGKANGKLVIECDGKSVTIDSPNSPQSFALTGVPAATENGKKTTATAYFQGDQTNCSKTITIDVPNAKEAVQMVVVDSLTGHDFVLTPKDADPANAYVWLVKNEQSGKTDTIMGTTQTLIISAFDTDSTRTYTYKEYYPATGSMEDLMTNGGYEANNSDAKYGVKGNKSPISDYDFWGYYEQTETTDINFYGDTLAGGVNALKMKNNGFAIVRNTHHFSNTYATVTAREGRNFALFDAATGEAGGNKKAWYAETQTDGKLQLKKGTTYVLSFWAANVNNYGEMDNAAKFRFFIEDISDPLHPVAIDSSRVLDLSLPEYRNNIWHQCSQTFFAAKDYNKVRISVVNQNKRTLIIGNDFALDDIQFHPISSVSKVVKSEQQFVVTAHEPKVDALTVTPRAVGCDATSYVVDVQVTYQNPAGQLILRDKTTGTDYPYAVSAPFDTPQVQNDALTLTIASGTTHEWEAYFADWTTAKQTATSVAPIVPTMDTAHIAFTEPACGEVTTTLTFDLTYTNQQGTLTYWVDGMTKQTATYSVADKTAQTLTDLMVTGVPADGKSNHVLHVSFDGANSCVADYSLPAVPFSPTISSVMLTGVTAAIQCGEDEYTGTVTITTPYDATGRNIIVTYEGVKDTIVTATGTTTTLTLTLTKIGGTAETVAAAYETTPTCTTTGTYTTPTRMTCAMIRDTICEGESYTLNGFSIMTPPVGDTLCVNATGDTLLLTVGDGHAMYSKWTDVLFINNASGRFVSYQWFEDGQAMNGETQQRLYNPAGLLGLYYCRMTTTDGKTIITCEYAFDDVPPSRTQNSEATSEVQVILDSMGRTVNDMQRAGVYIVVERIDGETRVRKEVRMAH